MNIRKIQWGVSGAAIAVALTYLLFPKIRIDAITVTLIGIAALPWLAPLFRSVELPGGIKVEFQELEAVARKVEAAGLFGGERPMVSQRRRVYVFEAVAGNDPNLVLAGLRIELESRLREITQSRDLPEDGIGIAPLMRQLREHGALTNEEVSALSELLPLLNQAAHGAQVDQRASQWALDFGSRLLEALEERLGEVSVPQLLDEWRKRDGAAVMEVGCRLSKAFVKSPAAFLRTMREDEESFAAWLEGLGNHTFTLFEGDGELEDDLYSAYYERLKERMIAAVEPLRQSELQSEAERVREALERTEIRRIW